MASTPDAGPSPGQGRPAGADGQAGYRRGEPGYRRITLALFAAGMATFVAMYGAQAVLPALSTQFSVGPAAAALAVSATTGMLALAIIPASVLSERFGRVPVMATSAVLSALVGVAVGFAGSLWLLVLLRALQGVLLAGVPATAMAYLAEEVHPGDLGAAMGRYIAGTTIGGLCGRVFSGLVLDVASWRWALEVVAVVALAFSLLFVQTAPPSRRFHAQPVGLRTTTANIIEHLRNPGLLALFGSAFLLMGGFVSVYNTLGYRTLAAPFNLSQTVVGLLFLMYLSGTVASALAGRLADRFGRGQVLLACEVIGLAGLVLSLVDHLLAVLVGILVFTAGFFAAHAVASGSVGLLATDHRAEASSTYMCLYYVGSSVLGALAGLAFSHGGWTGTVIFVGLAQVAAIGLALVVRTRTDPPATRG